MRVLSGYHARLLLFAKLSSQPVFVTQSPVHSPQGLGCKPATAFPSGLGKEARSLDMTRLS